MSTEAERERYGRIAYDAYGDHVGWKVFSGAEMPQWPDTLDRIREAWRAAGQKVAEIAAADTLTAPIHIYLDGKKIHEARKVRTIDELRAERGESREEDGDGQ